MNPWPELKWWDSGERQVVEEKLDDLRKLGVECNPEKNRLYAALRATPLGKARVAIIGQDPYPTHAFATGVAFSIPGTVERRDFPATLKLLLAEYSADLGHPVPNSGDLSRWTSRGCLLWNAIPSVQAGSPLSHDWDEYGYLTRELIQKLGEKGCVFALLGTVARRFEGEIDLTKNRVITTSHPSPRGNRNSKTPFTGSRIFSTINAKLREIGQDPIDWRLEDDTSGKNNLPGTGVVGGRVLPNTTGVDLGGLKGTVAPNLYRPWP